jgi:hypothetical protein
MLAVRRPSMTLDFHTALAVLALIAAVILVLQGGERLIPLIALVACALEVLRMFGLLELSSRKVKIEAILPAVLAITGGIAWVRSASKPAITAATVITLVGVIQLLHVFHVGGVP